MRHRGQILSYFARGTRASRATVPPSAVTIAAEGGT